MLTVEIDHKGGRPKEKPLHDVTVSTTSLLDVGIDKYESHRYQKIATSTGGVNPHLTQLIEERGKGEAAEFAAKEIERKSRFGRSEN